MESKVFKTVGSMCIDTMGMRTVPACSTGICLPSGPAEVHLLNTVIWTADGLLIGCLIPTSLVPPPGQSGRCSPAVPVHHCPPGPSCPHSHPPHHSCSQAWGQEGRRGQGLWHYITNRCEPSCLGSTMNDLGHVTAATTGHSCQYSCCCNVPHALPVCIGCLSNLCVGG
jgi:hypothetical protein